MARLWIITYDIADERRLRRVSKWLEQQAQAVRVQYSVFEVLADRYRLQLLRKQLAQWIDPAEDSVRYYPLCGSCIGRVRWQGMGNSAGAATYWVV